MTKAELLDTLTEWANSAEGKRAICQAVVNTDGLVESPDDASADNPYTKVRAFYTGGYNKLLKVEAKLDALIATLGQGDTPTNVKK